MLIDEVEAIWAAIDERDDWAAASTPRSPPSAGWARRMARMQQLDADA